MPKKGGRRSASWHTLYMFLSQVNQKPLTISLLLKEEEEEEEKTHYTRRKSEPGGG